VPALAEVVRELECHYDPAWAEPWDAVGLVCGDPETSVARVLFAVDPVEVVVDEAITGGFDLLVTHHPLFLGGTTSVAATTPKGRVVHRLLRAGIALYVAHTNADVASPGVSDALGDALGLSDLRPLLPELGARSGPCGLGRVGELAEPMTLTEFTDHVARSLPRTSWGVRAAGDPHRVVRTIAVCGGSGGDLAAEARGTGADVLLTSDLKHHAASESVADLGICLVDAAHWATEWPWLKSAARILATTVETSVSTTVTDPWTLHATSTTGGT